MKFQKKNLNFEIRSADFSTTFRFDLVRFDSVRIKFESFNVKAFAIYGIGFGNIVFETY